MGRGHKEQDRDWADHGGGGQGKIWNASVQSRGVLYLHPSGNQDPRDLGLKVLSP